MANLALFDAQVFSRLAAPLENIPPCFRHWVHQHPLRQIQCHAACPHLGMQTRPCFRGKTAQERLEYAHDPPWMKYGPFQRRQLSRHVWRTVHAAQPGICGGMMPQTKLTARMQIYLLHSAITEARSSPGIELSVAACAIGTMSTCPPPGTLRISFFSC